MKMSDPGTSYWQENWFLDGLKASVTNNESGMEFTAGPEAKNDAHHAVLWTKQEFSGDIKLQYKYTRNDHQTKYVTILYIQATGIGEEPYAQDITAWNELREVPKMSKYFNFMNTLHISYAAFGNSNSDPDSDYVRVRRYPVTETVRFSDMEVPPSYYNSGFFKSGHTYLITVIKTADRLFFKVEGDGNQKVFSWNLSGVIPVIHGRIGLRHMYTRSATYKDFKIWTK